MLKHYVFTVASSLMLLIACSGGNGMTSDNSSTGKPTKQTNNTLEPITTEVAESKKTDIRLEIGGAGDGWVKVIGVLGNQNYIADSTEMKADKARFQREEKLPGGMYFFMLPDGDTFIQVLLDKDQEFSLTADISDPNDAIVEGSLDNELLYKNLKYQASMQPQFDAVNAELAKETFGTAAYKAVKAKQQALLDKRAAHIDSFRQQYPNAFFTKFKLAGQNPDVGEPLKPNGELDTFKQVYLYRTNFWNDVDFGDERLLRTPVYHNKLKRYIKELTHQNMDSLRESAAWVAQKSFEGGNNEIFKFTVNFIAIEYKQSTVMGGEAVYVDMIDKYFTYDRAFWSDSSEIRGLRRQANEMKASLLGEIGQDVTAADINGKMHSLYDLKAPIIVVYIFNPDCEHCKEETPKLKKVYQEWHSKGVDVFGIGTETEIGPFTSYLKQVDLPWVNVIDPTYESKYYLKYHIDITPELYVLNKDKKIIAKNVKSEQLPAIFEKEFAKMK